MNKAPTGASGVSESDVSGDSHRVHGKRLAELVRNALRKRPVGKE
jgi:hypothetical protein